MAGTSGSSRGRSAAAVAALAVLALLLGWLLRNPAGEPRAETPAIPEPPSAFPVPAGPPVGPPVRSAEVPAAPPEPVPEPAPVPAAAAEGGAGDEELDFDWEVTVLDHRDRPVEGVVVRRDETGGPVVETGASGRARIPWAKEGAPTVHLSGAAPDMSVRLETRSSVVRLPALAALEVVVVDGTTGFPVRGGTVALRRRQGPPAALRPAGDRFVLDAPLLRRGFEEAPVFEVGIPAGFASLERGILTVKGTISRFAERVRAEVVIWPEARVLVRVRKVDGTPAAGANLTDAFLGGWHHFQAGVVTTDGSGSARLPAIPFIRGERVNVMAELDGRIARATKPVALVEPGEEILVEITLPEKAGAAAIGIGGGAGGMFGGRRGSKRNLRMAFPDAVLEVEVRRRDGSPAADAQVVATPAGGIPCRARTGPDGTISFKGVLPAGEVVVSLEEPGLLAAPETVVLVSGSAGRVVLRETEGAASAVLVLDADGRPAAGAALTVATGSGLPYVLVDGAVQVLGIRTGPDGRCALPGLPPGTVTVTATLGSRTASASAEAGLPVEITLPAPR